MFREILRSVALRVPAIRELKAQRDTLQAEVSRLRGTAPDSTAYEVLEGTPHSRYAVPVDYKPSRDFSPRWGYARPRIKILDDWFRSYEADYNEFLSSMRKRAPHLSRIPLEFSEANLPEPAWAGAPYCPFDAVALYTILFEGKPKRYLEIGSGVSTCFAHKAIVDSGSSTQIISIDPEPRAKIDAICDTVIRDGLETCDLALFDNLEAGDVLFFDGSHRSFMNSDVSVFFIDVLPRIKPGVIVHIHDVALPWDYDPFFKNWYWNETYLLAVYMMGNMHRIRPIAPTAFLCRDELFAAHFQAPILDLGMYNDGWRGGGAMWFTHTS
jgi:predicted O-methyltransferase YrrM